MKIDAALATLQLKLNAVEGQIKSLLKSECSNDDELKQLLSTRQQLIDGMKCMIEGYELLNK